MIRIRNNPLAREVRCSADVLKWVGFVCLCMGSLSSAVFQQNIIGLDSYTSQTLSDAMAADTRLFALASAASVLSLLSALALPLYAKLAYEGWRHTSSRRRYLLRLGLCALVSEIPYDLSVSGAVFDWSRQGPLWGLLLAVVMLCALEQLRQARSVPGAVVKGLIVLAACIWAVLLQSYLGVLTVLLAAAFYLLEGRPRLSLLAGLVICLFQFPAPFGMALVYWYDGKPCKTPKRLFYLLYPVQLLAFYLLGRLTRGLF